MDKPFPESFPLQDSWLPYIIAVLVGIAVTIRSYMGGRECPSQKRIDDKIVIITGASSGLGLETALELAKRGGKIILACRNLEDGQAAKSKMQQLVADAHVEVSKLDLSALKSVHQFAESLSCSHVDVLINNAGVAFHHFELTDEGFETHFVTNYLGHFLLTQLLLPKLKAAPQARIINVSSQAHFQSTLRLEDLNREDSYVPREAFGQSKLCLILMSRHMAFTLNETSVTINTVHPGIVRGTGHMRHSPVSQSWMVRFSMLPWMWLFLKSPSQGAQTIVYAAIAGELSQVSGKYFGDCEVKEPSHQAQDADLARTLYIESLRLVGLQE